MPPRSSVGNSSSSVYRSPVSVCPCSVRINLSELCCGSPRAIRDAELGFRASACAREAKECAMSYRCRTAVRLFIPLAFPP
jgi:hypothetical protein